MSSVDKSGSIGLMPKPTLPQDTPKADPKTGTVKIERAKEDTGNALKMQELLSDMGYDAKMTRLEFETDPDLRRVVVRVIDRESGEVVREIPPEEMLQVARIMRKLMATNDALKGNLIEVVS